MHAYLYLQSDVTHTHDLNLNKKIIRQIGLSRLIRRSHQFKTMKEKQAVRIIEAKSDGTIQVHRTDMSGNFLNQLIFWSSRKSSYQYLRAQV